MAGTAASDSPAADKSAEWLRFWNWRRPVLDLVATTLWGYALLKLFIVDIDTELVGDIARYRFFFFLLVVLAIVLWFGKTGRIVAGFAYILGFPAVLLCWKLPKFLIKPEVRSHFSRR